MNRTEKCASYFTPFYLQLEAARVGGWGGDQRKEAQTRRLRTRENRWKCVCVCVHSQVCMGVHANMCAGAYMFLHVEARGQPWASFLRHHPKIWFLGGGDKVSHCSGSGQVS